MVALAGVVVMVALLALGQQEEQVTLPHLLRLLIQMQTKEKMVVLGLMQHLAVLVAAAVHLQLAHKVLEILVVMVAMERHLLFLVLL
jgi:hypothetical protein